jgi:hypothetical protein
MKTENKIKTILVVLKAQSLRKIIYNKEEELKKLTEKYDDLCSNCIYEGLTDELIDEMKRVMGKGYSLMQEIDMLNSGLEKFYKQNES